MRDNTRKAHNTGFELIKNPHEEEEEYPYERV
jgi:hypothetical protein